MRTTSLFIVVCAALAVGVFVFAARRPAIAPVSPPNATSFAPALVRRGAQLAAIGDCDVCHTAPSGRAFAGGLPVPTPFGVIFSTNITPDAQTGIGNWSEAAFRRAMREGVRRDGQYLYPAFPYDHFTLVSDDDDRALYAFLMTREPVHAIAPADRLPFPLNVRLLMFGWNLFFLHKGPYRADAAQSPAWNRGAYLVNGLGHCGACHTPRNFLGAEKSNAQLSGGEAEGWTAYALDASSPAPVPWNAEALAQYLYRGFEPTHGTVRGPMAQVVAGLRTVPQSDVQAIAVYVTAQMRHPASPPPQAGSALAAQRQRGQGIAPQSADSQAAIAALVQTGSRDEGAQIYAAACAGCHQGPRAMPYGGIDLALSTAISGPSAQNLINVVLYGLPAADGASSPIMPGFAASLSDAQMIALANYLRAHFSHKGPWSDVEDDVRAARNARSLATTSPAATRPTAPAVTQRTNGNEAQR
jgi:mono/diheme cytochrome c family protein